MTFCARVRRSEGWNPNASSAIYRASLTPPELAPGPVGLSNPLYRIARPMTSVTPFLTENLLAHLFKHTLCRRAVGIPGKPLLQNFPSAV